MNNFKNRLRTFRVFGFKISILIMAVFFFSGTTSLASEVDYYYQEEKRGEAATEALFGGAFTAGVIAKSAYCASAAGAGALTGYAGIAGAVSSLGLGGVTTAIAGAMGSSATGAAATAVVTSAVGGPVVMGAILVGGTAAASYGIYKGGQALWKWISEEENK